MYASTEAIAITSLHCMLQFSLCLMHVLFPVYELDTKNKLETMIGVHVHNVYSCTCTDVQRELTLTMYMSGQSLLP